ncbi:SRPBCC family protein [Kitasatospora sp. DSM 101779]|uniref:SRPBCC family protein n=1 Tax=Kitasatospora sp. DSM 101779 TaxID=2853165 RepID=UPI0021D934BD|nr:SRPBCC family protein [Kitasatospora sp. DSM 101779]MCU7822851.1 SRPBCC family protein [Kitasatospora sp. DSM 101779]
MRYADGPAAQGEVRVGAAPSRVWELVTDIGLPARLSPELQRVEWLGGADAPAVGARFAGFNRHPLAGDWRTVSQIVEFDVERLFGWAVLDADGRYGDAADDLTDRMATWRFELAPEGAGTRVRQSVLIGPGRSGISLWIDRMPEREEQLVAGRLDELRTGIEATLAGVKALAEDGGERP